MMDAQFRSAGLVHLGEIWAATRADTARVASLLASYLRPGQCLGLTGPIGAGKTTFVRGLLRSLGHSGDVCSPTFVLEQTYEVPASLGRTELHHWDLYRLAGKGSVWEILDSGPEGQRVDLIEWAELYPELLPKLTGLIVFSFPGNDGAFEGDLELPEDEPRNVSFWVASGEPLFAENVSQLILDYIAAQE